jgi:predicted GNAT family acetyltransferase
LRLIKTDDPALVSDEEYEAEHSDEAVARKRLAAKNGNGQTAVSVGTPISANSQDALMPGLGHSSGGTVTIAVGKGPNSQ